MSFVQQWLEDLQGLFEPSHTMVEGQPKRLILRLVPSRADAQDQAPMAHLIDGRRHFRQDGWMAEGVACNQRAEFHVLGRFCQRCQHRPAFPNSTGRLTRIAIQEVVREPETVEAICLGLLCDGADRLIRTLAVVFAVVRQEYHQPNLHSLYSTFFGTRYFLPEVQTLLSTVRRIWKAILSVVPVPLLHDTLKR